MDVRIEEWAGKVRDVLDGSGPMHLASVARRITDATTNEVALAVGWLAHEGAIRFSKRWGLWEIDLHDVRDRNTGRNSAPERRQGEEREDAPGG